MSDIFVSHAHKDKPIVDALVDLFDTGLGISPHKIFCTALEGMGIPSGENFINYIKSKLSNPRIIVLILSSNYLASEFCLCEMGAAWALSNNILPIIVPPVDYSDISSVLLGIQARRIDYDGDLNKIRDELIAKLDLHPLLSRWDAKRNQFLQNIPRLINEQLPPPKVTYEKFRQLQLKYDDSLKEISSYSTELGQLRKNVSDYRKCQNRDEIRRLAMEISPEWLKFKFLSNEAKTIISSLPQAVVKLLAHEMSAFATLGSLERWEEESLEDRKNASMVAVRTEVRTYHKPRIERYQKPNYDGFFGSGDYGASFKDRSYLESSETIVKTYKTYSILWEHPKINKIYEVLTELKEFLKAQADNESFLLEYQEEFGHEAGFNEKQLWICHLGYKSN